MTTSHHPSAAWRKSTYSNGQAECVEVASGLPGITAVRDSKNPHGPALTFTHQQWHAFTAQLKTGDKTCRFPVISSNYLGSFPPDLQLEVLRGR